MWTLTRLLFTKKVSFYSHNLSCLLGDNKCVWVMILGSLSSWKETSIIPILERMGGRLECLFLIDI